MENIDLDYEGKAILFKHVRKALEFMPYGEPRRVALTWVALVGARICEIENLSLNNFMGQYCLWKPRKNQKGYRKEKLPEWFFQELEYMINRYPISNTQIFPFNAASLTRRFNKEIRPLLGEEWNKKHPVLMENCKIRLVYNYQLRMLRQNFCTHDYAKEIDNWGYEVAIEKTAERMRHSSKKITAYHYVQNFDKLDIQRYKHFTMGEILKGSTQSKLLEFFT